MSSSAELPQAESQAIEYLDARRAKIFSYTGGWFPGRGVFSHGFNMLEQLTGHKTYMQVLILNATGRLVDKAFGDWMEAVYSCLSWPDPRIWCNQIGALAGAARCSTLLATVMGCLGTDSRSYGVLPLKEGLGFIQTAMAQHRQGMSAEQIVAAATSGRGGKPYIVGYIRPIAKGDERLDAMERVSRNLNIPIGEHLRLAYDIEAVLREKFNEGMNINGYVSAVLSDQGFSPEDAYNMFPTLVASGVTACYLDTYRRPPDSFLPLRCEDLDYQGPAARPVPD